MDSFGRIIDTEEGSLSLDVPSRTMTPMALTPALRPVQLATPLVRAESSQSRMPSPMCITPSILSRRNRSPLSVVSSIPMELCNTPLPVIASDDELPSPPRLRLSPTSVPSRSPMDERTPLAASVPQSRSPSLTSLTLAFSSLALSRSPSPMSLSLSLASQAPPSSQAPFCIFSPRATRPFAFVPLLGPVCPVSPMSIPSPTSSNATMPLAPPSPMSPLSTPRTFPFDSWSSANAASFDPELPQLLAAPSWPFPPNSPPPCRWSSPMSISTSESLRVRRIRFSVADDASETRGRSTSPSHSASPMSISTSESLPVRRIRFSVADDASETRGRSSSPSHSSHASSSSRRYPVSPHPRVLGQRRVAGQFTIGCDSDDEEDVACFDFDADSD